MLPKKSLPLGCAIVTATLSLSLAQDAPPPAASLITAPEEAVKSITAHELEEHMRFLASDFMRGRDTMSNEIKIAAEYLAANVAAAGGEPMGDQKDGKPTYFAKFPLERSAPEPEATKMRLIYEKDGTRREEPVAYGDDFKVLPTFIRTAEVEAPLVFAGYGLVNESKEVNDYKDLDVKNRIVLVFEGAPEGSPISRNEANVFNKMGQAASRGALGLVLIKKPGSTDAENANSGGAIRAFRPGRGVSLPRNDNQGGMPVVTLEDRARDMLFGLGGIDGSALKNGVLVGLKMRIATQAKKESFSDNNVIAFFPGTDPEKRKEVIVFSAHYDHVGVNERGELFNGSDDNASGTSAILEIAEAFGTGPKPARSVAFLWVSGEEKGLLGSRWFSEHSTLPPDYKIVADINLDMVSRNEAKEIGITPSPKHPEYNTLVVAGEAASAAEQVTPKFNADEFFGRTDSYNFANKGIPVVFFFSGIHDDYHRPTDDTDKADFEKAARIARVAYRLGWHAASAPEAPAKVAAPTQ